MSEEPKTSNIKNPGQQPLLPPEAIELDLSPEELDQLLSEEDPSFNKEFAPLRSEKFEVDIEVYI